MKANHHPIRMNIWRRLLAAVFLALSVLGWLRMSQALIHRETIETMQASVGVWYLGFSGAAWGLLALTALIGLILRRAWGLVACRLAVLIMAAWFWADRLFLSQSPAARANLPFLTGFTIIGLLAVWLITIERPAAPDTNGGGEDEHGTD